MDVMPVPDLRPNARPVQKLMERNGTGLVVADLQNGNTKRTALSCEHRQFTMMFERRDGFAIDYRMVRPACPWGSSVPGLVPGVIQREYFA